MTIEELRELYKTSTPDMKLKLIPIGKAVAENPKYGSKDLGGNGYCYTCFIEPARDNHWNCEKCASKKTVAGIIHSVEFMKNSLKEMKPNPKWEDMAENVFNPSQNL